MRTRIEHALWQQHGIAVVDELECSRAASDVEIEPLLCFVLGLASTLQAFFGDSQADQRARTIDTAMDRLEAFRTKMSNMRRRLQDSKQTSFVVVTVPTKLSVAESKRLVHELDSQGVTVTDIVVNQCVVELKQGTDRNE